ncbi:hypothetical protein QUQ61_001087 [Escherichia coli]|nr:hypothetical protein [Escherichia coli]
MITITKEFTKEQLIEQAKKNIEVLRVAVGRVPGAYDAAVIHLKLAEITLASLEAEPIGEVSEKRLGLVMDGTVDLGGKSTYRIIKGEKAMKLLPLGTKFYTAPPVPVVPEEKPMPNPLKMYAVDAVAAIAEVRGWNACRAAMLQSGNFRENKSSSTNNFREIAETSTNYPVIPSEVLSAIQKVAKIRADFDDFDGDRRGIGDCLDEAEQELIVTINKYASQLAAEPIATNDVREQQTAVPPVPEIQADVAQAIENLKQKLVECNRYNYCADAVKGVEDACLAAMRHGPESVSQTYKLPPLSSSEVNDAAWKLHNMLTEHGPLNGRQFNNLKGCFYEALKVAMRNYPVTPDSWISCSELMPNDAQWCVVDAEDGYYVQCWSEGQGWLGDDISLRNCDVIRWMAIPEPLQQDGE